MAIDEFAGIPFFLVTGAGILALNDPSSSAGYFITVDSGCAGGTKVRSSKDDIPQADGSILHRRFLSGYELQLSLLFGIDVQKMATCLTTPSTRQMNDTLSAHLMAMVHTTGRILYTPTGADDRLLDQVQLLAAPTVDISPAQTQVAFTLDSPFPYTIDYSQITTVITGGGPDTLTNLGTAPMFPVFQVDGPTEYFEINNLDTGLSIIYDSALPGANPITIGNYAEITTFRNSIYLNGDGANLMPGIDVQSSDFFPLQVGDNDIEVIGDGTNGPPDVTVLWQAAWL